jgi:stage II sporulation protein AA (anti-sigma F factor antagonist)
MGIEIWRQGSWLVGELTGDLDIASVPVVRVRLERSLAKQEVDGLILDLSGVNFLDSSGLGFILGRYHQLAEDGGKMIITGIQGQVKRVFELSGLTELILRKESLLEALQAIREEK